MKPTLTEEGEAHLPKLLVFGKHLMKSRDIDPLYPMLEHVIEERNMDEDEAYWFTFLYVAWYNISVGLHAWHLCSEASDRILPHIYNAPLAWPTGIERRASRGGRVIGHIESFLEASRETGTAAWFLQELDMEATTLEEKHANWKIVNARLQTLRMNGRWAAYKHCEVLRRVHGVPIIAPDMGNQFSSGPREGLAMIYGEIEGQGPKVIEQLDRQGVHLQRLLSKRGLETDIEELETILCNWKSLRKGKYVVGHDIDENQEQIDLALERGLINDEEAALLYEAREATLPGAYLGELHDWHGVDKERCKAYARSGLILGRKCKCHPAA